MNIPKITFWEKQLLFSKAPLLFKKLFNENLEYDVILLDKIVDTLCKSKTNDIIGYLKEFYFDKKSYTLSSLNENNLLDQSSDENIKKYLE